jgi:hypothetical protein
VSGQTVAEIAISQQAEQAALVSLLTDPLQRAWTLLNPSEPSTLDNFILAIAAIIRHFGVISATQSSAFYDSMRVASGVAGSYQAAPASTPPMDQIEAGIRWATKGLWGPNPDLTAVETLVTGVVEKNVLDMGRQTILKNVRTDRKSKGWARETEPGACAFCAMLATRGAVYRSETSASFETHDHCRCVAVPEFNKYEPSAQVREWQQLYKESTKGVHGSKNSQRAFRKAFEHKYPASE